MVPPKPIVSAGVLLGEGKNAADAAETTLRRFPSLLRAVVVFAFVFAFFLGDYIAVAQVPL